MPETSGNKRYEFTFGIESLGELRAFESANTGDDYMDSVKRAYATLQEYEKKSSAASALLAASAMPPKWKKNRKKNK
ncbi:MAG: hypothetical protein V4691_05500 [Pseudomonadota bacterium]